MWDWDTTMFVDYMQQKQNKMEEINVFCVRRQTPLYVLSAKSKGIVFVRALLAYFAKKNLLLFSVGHADTEGGYYMLNRRKHSLRLQILEVVVLIH